MITGEHLRKRFTSVTAVDDLSLTVERGQIFGLLGPNGAGKSTTIRMLLNIITPDAGRVMYDSQPYSPALQNKIGYLPEERGLYRKNKLLPVILYFASLKGIVGADAKTRAMRWLERFELSGYANKKVEELSKGNQQKVQFITSILHEPQFIILDEPFAGLDPVNQILLKDILQELKQQNRAIIFSTHQMESAEKLCDEICLINRGRVVLDGTLKGVKQKFGRNAIRLEYSGDGSFLSSLPAVRHATVYENYAELSLDRIVPSAELLSAITPRLELRKYELLEPSLNSIFLEVVGNDGEAASSEPPSVAPPPRRVTNPRITKARLSVVLSAVLFVVAAVLALVKPGFSWQMPAWIGAVLLLSLVRYFTTRRKFGAVEGESHEG